MELNAGFDGSDQDQDWVAHVGIGDEGFISVSEKEGDRLEDKRDGSSGRVRLLG